MNKTERENMLLFSKERFAGLYRYRLYFTSISSLRDETPRVFRLLVKTPFSFNKFEIGRVYKLTYVNVHIHSFEPNETFNLQEDDFSKLLQTRDFKFMDKKTSAVLRNVDEPKAKDRYYSYEEMRDIINYKQDLLTAVATGTVSAVITGAALLIPFGLYALMLYLIISGQMSMAGYTSKSLALPIMGIGALPAVLFCMSALYALSELVLLRIDFTKWNLLKKYTLSWGGIRKSFYFEESDIRYLKKFGLISGVVFAVTLLLALIV
ncbi:MAG: hypothetical protein WDA65_03160 [Christensenellales bacterium]